MAISKFQIIGEDVFNISKLFLFFVFLSFKYEFHLSKYRDTTMIIWAMYLKTL